MGLPVESTSNPEFTNKIDGFTKFDVDSISTSMYYFSLVSRVDLGGFSYPQIAEPSD